MDQKLVKQVVATFPDLSLLAAQRTLRLLEQGNTVPFIARYRKEQTGNLNEVQIWRLQDRYQRQEKLAKRRQAVVTKLTAQGHLTKRLRQQLDQATTLQQLEDLYLPYKPKRRTKAEVAKEQGLAPLAAQLLQFTAQPVATLARPFVDPTKGVLDSDAALAGAQAIISQSVSERPSFREWIRTFTWQQGQLTTTKKATGVPQDDRQVYANYYDFTEDLAKVPAYRVLAINRGEREALLRVKITVVEHSIQNYLRFHVIGQQTGPSVPVVEQALTVAYRRYLRPALERELRQRLTKRAQTHAIQVFGNNLYHLLMQPPLKGKVVMGFDPAYRTGCKLAILDPQGRLLAKAILLATPPATADQRQQAAVTLQHLLTKYHVAVIAIGNGTAAREAEQFVAEVVAQLPTSVHYVIVNEAGASVYSASAVARAEFPELPVEERSAISIGRRLQDPLAELIKIDPKAVGVGQYQHDLAETQLDEQLQRVVETVVNQVGVNVNTASPQLLASISGLTPAVAYQIVSYRNQHGKFTERTQLQRVQRLGPKAFEQAVGFLRIIGGHNPFDNTDLHPESYPLASAILNALGIAKADLTTQASQTCLAQGNVSKLAHQLNQTEPQIRTVLAGLQHPGRDLRDQMPAPLLRDTVVKLTDLRVGMQLQGTVRNVTDFGAFVDIGVKQDGLVHISHLKAGFVADPASVVAIGDIVTVWVIGVDEQRGRIQLSMLDPQKER
ncbi:helix-hairpin-helix domain-containing protein [Fructilactobacillus ixorae]